MPPSVCVTLSASQLRLGAGDPPGAVAVEAEPAGDSPGAIEGDSLPAGDPVESEAEPGPLDTEVNNTFCYALLKNTIFNSRKCG